MILYHPIEGDAYTKDIQYKPRTCFLMTKIGTPIPQEIKNIRNTLSKYLRNEKIKIIDAHSFITGKDFMVKIWESIVSVPLGIAIISDELESGTKANIFYEIGLLHALGKETLIIKTKNCSVPSDFIRTEYIEYDRSFKVKITKYLNAYFQQAKYYESVALELGKDPILAIDYLRRAFLISGDGKYKKTMRSIFKKNKTSLDPKTAGKIENLL